MVFFFSLLSHEHSMADSNFHDMVTNIFTSTFRIHSRHLTQLLSIGGHRFRRKKRLHRSCYWLNKLLNRSHRSRYLPPKKFERFHRSRYLSPQQIGTVTSSPKKIVTVTSFPLLVLSKNVTASSFPLLFLPKHCNCYIVLVSNIGLCSVLKKMVGF
jgi:hypothetical protein